VSVLRLGYPSGLSRVIVRRSAYPFPPALPDCSSSLPYESFLTACINVQDTYTERHLVTHNRLVLFSPRAIGHCLRSSSGIATGCSILSYHTCATAMTNHWVLRLHEESPNTACRSRREAILNYPLGRVQGPSILSLALSCQRHRLSMPTTLELPIALGNYPRTFECSSSPSGRGNQHSRLPLSISFLRVQLLGRGCKPLFAMRHDTAHLLLVSDPHNISPSQGSKLSPSAASPTVTLKTPFGGALGFFAWIIPIARRGVVVCPSFNTEY